jgi:hypothetical protein
VEQGLEQVLVVVVESQTHPQQVDHHQEGHQQANCQQEVALGEAAQHEGLQDGLAEMKVNGHGQERTSLMLERWVWQEL